MQKIGLGLLAACAFVATPAAAMEAVQPYETYAGVFGVNLYHVEVADGVYENTGVSGVLLENHDSGFEHLSDSHSSNVLAQSSRAGAYSNSGWAGEDYVTSNVNYAASSSSSLAGGLKATSRIEVNQLFWDNQNNAPMLDVGEFVQNDGQTHLEPISMSYNFDGALHGYYAMAEASISDMISITGGAGLSQVKIVYGLDGLFDQSADSGWHSYGAVNIFGNGGFFHFEHHYASDQMFDMQLSTDFIDVVDSQFLLDVSLRVEAGFELTPNIFFEDSGIVPGGSVLADFGNSLTIAKIFGFDANGNEVLITSALGSDGTLLPFATGPATGAVPEPTTWAMLIAGFGMVGFMSRRRRDALAA